MLIRNSIEPSSTGNCTHFDQSLCDSKTFLNISWKNRSNINVDNEVDFDMERLEIEKSLIEVDHLDPNELKDNILYYIGGFIV